MTLAQRLAEGVVRSADGCLVWQHGCNGHGYAAVYNPATQKMVRANRAAWEVARGPIPDGLFVLHRCDNRACINVEHLFLGTQTDNIRDAVAKGRHSQVRKTHCAKGHAFDAQNTAIGSRGQRCCRTCQRAANRRCYARRAAA